MGKSWLKNRILTALLLIMVSVDMLTGCGRNTVKDDNLIGSSEVAEAGAAEAVTPANISETESDKASEKSDVLSEDDKKQFRD